MALDLAYGFYSREYIGLEVWQGHPSCRAMLFGKVNYYIPNHSILIFSMLDTLRRFMIYTSWKIFVCV